MKNELLKALGRCRVMNQVQVETVFSLTSEEIESLVSQKILVKEESENGETYVLLTEKGEHVLKEDNPDFGEIYRGFILEHDLTLMDFYLRCTEEERENWMTRDDMIKTYRFPGTIDGAFMNRNGQFEGVEVLKNTAKYSSVEKAEAFNKEVDIEKMNYLMYK